MPQQLNNSLQWMMEEMDPLDKQLQFLTSNEDNLPKNTRGPSKDCRQFEGQLKLHEDYISENLAYGNCKFKRQFWVSKKIFRSICNDLVCHDEYFLQKQDCCGFLGLSTKQKITAALWILAYGVAADATNKYIWLADTTSRNTLHRFAKGLVELDQEKFLQAPNINNLCKILYDNAQRGFPGCIGVGVWDYL